MRQVQVTVNIGVPDDCEYPDTEIASLVQAMFDKKATEVLRWCKAIEDNELRLHKMKMPDTTIRNGHNKGLLDALGSPCYGRHSSGSNPVADF